MVQWSTPTRHAGAVLNSEDKRGLIERLLMERISLRGISRAVGVTLKWLLGFLVQCFEALPDHLHVQPVSCQHDVLIQRLKVEADEMASFVHRIGKCISDCPEVLVIPGRSKWVRMSL